MGHLKKNLKSENEIKSTDHLVTIVFSLPKISYRLKIFFLETSATSVFNVFVCICVTYEIKVIFVLRGNPRFQTLIKCSDSRNIGIRSLEENTKSYER